MSHEGERQLELGLERVVKGQDPWMDLAAYAIGDCAEAHYNSRSHFTTDNVWRWLEVRDIDPPRDPRAMGAAIRRAKKDGVIEATGEYRKSTRPACHRRPIPVYRAKQLDNQ